jgi:hypothetical protein
LVSYTQQIKSGQWPKLAGDDKMKKWQMISSVVVALVAVLSLTVSAFAQTPQPLSNETSAALVMAINDEYKARATYQAVLDKFGGRAIH